MKDVCKCSHSLNPFMWALFVYKDCRYDLRAGKPLILPETRSTTLHRNYRENCEKRCCSGSHKQFKTLFKDSIVRLMIISLYIYKELRLQNLS